MQNGRRKYAALLLAVILPALLLSSFHRHVPVQEDGCDSCTGSLPHKHLGIGHGTDTCLLCQFLALGWVSSSETEAPVPDSGHYSFKVEESARPGATPGLFSSRAPPVVF